MKIYRALVDKVGDNKFTLLTLLTREFTSISSSFDYQDFVPSLGLVLLSVMLVMTACAKPLTAQSSLAESNQFNFWCLGGKSTAEKLRCEIAKAQQAKNLAEIKKLTEVYIQVLGSHAGVPDLPAHYHAVDPQSPRLTAADISTAFEPYVNNIQKRAWWSSHPDPRANNQGEPRDVASVITGLLAARHAGAKNPALLLQMAKDAGGYLLWAQAQAGQGLYPYAEMAGKGSGDWQVHQRLLRLAAARGISSSDILVNHWFVRDLGYGGEQYHNGLAGVAVLELYEATGDQKYLDSARQAADWAVQQPVVPNWNYNAFSVSLLANAYRITGDRRYLESAKEKARLGIYPGQLRSGLYVGRWADPHNARFVYHCLLIRGLGALVAVLPQDDPDLPPALEALSIALQSLNAELSKNGVPVDPGSTSLTEGASVALEVLSRLEIDLPTSSGRLPDLGRQQAIDLLSRYATGEFVRGQLPVAPSAWGLFLQYLSLTKKV